MDKVKIGVLVSGSGSNLQSIIDRIEEGRLQAEVKIVISNTPDAYALKRSGKHGLPTHIINHHDFPKREDFDLRMVSVLKSHAVELVVLAGFMRVLTPSFLQAFPLKVMNIHPALLPSFPGLHVQKQALEYGVKFSGCTVHFVEEGVDTGPIIIQAVVPVLDGDTVDTLSARILHEEHLIYPQAIQLYAEGRLAVQGRRVLVTDGRRAEPAALHNPSLTM
ncbi:MAG: phosphoribosylglycinamide formyltransferase [Syntrophales bacterium LBB04]|nr:phosphoribosylglycinamide formyltransferase [Syntrophales bacterium LBB04]